MLSSVTDKLDAVVIAQNLTTTTIANVDKIDVSRIDYTKDEREQFNLFRNGVIKKVKERIRQRDFAKSWDALDAALDVALVELNQRDASAYESKKLILRHVEQYLYPPDDELKEVTRG